MKEIMVKDGILDILLWRQWREEKTLGINGQEIPVGLGASLAATICGLSGGVAPIYRCYGTPSQAWLEATGRKERKESNAAMERGHDEEPKIAQVPV